MKAALIFILCVVATPVYAQSFPAKPVRLIVPYPAGGATDTMARIGAVMLPMDHRWTAGEQERVATHFGASLILAEPGAQIPSAPNITIDAAWQQAVDRAPNCPNDPSAAPLAAGGSAPWLV